MKPAADFWKRKASSDGLALYCKECFGLRNATSYRGKQEKQGKKTRAYRRHSTVPEGMKYCAQCQEIKSVDEFGRNRAVKSGLTSYCRPCHNVVMAEGKRRNHGSQRSYLLKLRYGLGAGQVEEMKAQQGGICVICLRGEAKHVDHSHLTGVVRGLLCFKCNGALGQFRDTPRYLRDAAIYLELRRPHAQSMRLELGVAVIDGRSRFIQEHEWREIARSKGPMRSARHRRLKGRYGIDEQDVEKLLAVQRGICAICWDVPAEHLDHDHATRVVRGMLCGGCNTGMGMLGDDPISLRRGADYLLGELIKVVRMADGGERMSFTVPDVDPATVPLDGWEPHRELDGQHRERVLELSEDEGRRDLPTSLPKRRGSVCGSWFVWAVAGCERG